MPPLLGCGCFLSSVRTVRVYAYREVERGLEVQVEKEEKEEDKG